MMLHAADSTPLSRTMIFDASWAGGPYSFCVSAVPFNGSSPVTDTLMGNNGSCASVQFQIPSGVPSVTTGPAASVYPVPAAAAVHLKYGVTTSGTVSILDLQGRRLSTEAISGREQTIAIGHLQPGIYLLQIQAADGKKETLRIVRE